MLLWLCRWRLALIAGAVTVLISWCCDCVDQLVVWLIVLISWCSDWLCWSAGAVIDCVDQLVLWLCWSAGAVIVLISWCCDWLCWSAGAVIVLISWCCDCGALLLSAPSCPLPSTPGLKQNVALRIERPVSGSLSVALILSWRDRHHY